METNEFRLTIVEAKLETSDKPMPASRAGKASL
jgi:hypothetical protein